MKLIVRDKEIFQNIDPNVLATHLEATGWQKVALVYENTWIWRKKNDEGELLEIKQPVRQEFDAPHLIYEAIKELEVVENRSQLDIVGELLTSLPNATISGWINKIDWHKGAIAQITVIGFVLGKLRKIHLELAETDYQLAIEAYEGDRP
ncbi:MAG: hypothetical protein HC849_04550 [Oscillatoriales cyanobacterium RU_3_3]|nr:hypothetical protein [Oscillatoriales cyanobacterium RU_3_3]